MASKQYISIIRLLDHCDISTEGEFNLSRVKKQLQAEYNMAPAGFIEVDGYTYNRHDVFEEIEHPDFPQRLAFHKQIWKSPQILNMLENNKTNLNGLREEFTPFWKNKEFDLFFSPYFAGPFAYLSRTYLADKDMWAVGNLLGYEDFIQPEEREEAFRPIRQFFEENIRTLRNVNKDNYKMMRPQIAHWIDTDWYPFFNNLPQEFYEQKVDVTVMIINMGVAIQKISRKDCQKTSEQLISLQDTPEDLRKTIVSNHSIYHGSSSTGSSWKGGWWIVWIIIGIIRAVSSDGCSNSNSRSSIKYNYDYPDLSKYMQKDTTFKGLVLDTNNSRGFFDSLAKKNKPVKRITSKKKD